MKLVVDSTVDLPKELVAKHNIEVVPLTIQLGDKTYRDYFDIDPDKYCQELENTKLFPTTAQPSPQDFIAVYEKLLQKKEDIISLHISSKLSGTYQSAMMAKEKLASGDICVVDSKQTSIGLGVIALAVAGDIENGVNKEDILNHIESIISRVNVLVAVDSLDYLQRGGRIGKASVFLGSMLNIKPILSLKDGEIHPLEKVRGRKLTGRRLVTHVQAAAAKCKKLKVAVVYVGNRDIVDSFLEQVAKISNVYVEYVGKAGGVIVSHVGPGAVGVAYYLDK
ncbi:MAG: DegV family protein [Candidatus Omnitrophica bacterium]|nr:DegV family protein [Candidatus Omnitrophota bacterium]